MELEHTRTVLGQVERHRDDLAAELAAARERAQADAMERAELRRLLQTALQRPALPAPAAEDAGQVPGRDAEVGEIRPERSGRHHHAG